jgi:hypothetical protein
MPSGCEALGLVFSTTEQIKMLVIDSHEYTKHRARAEQVDPELSS